MNTPTHHRGIGVYAPSGYALNPDAVERAIARFRDAGHRVIVDPTALARWQRFSAPDDERLAAVWRMASNPEVEVAIAVRGGYGWSRLLERLDFDGIAAARKVWLGHSDFTAFQLAAFAHTGMISYAGPMVAYDFGAETSSSFTLEHCWGVLGNKTYAVQCELVGPTNFAAAGVLWGGNLAMVAHLVGTPHFPTIKGGILFLEDVGEHPYRIERMLYQLHMSGVLADQRAVLFGDFSAYQLAPNDNGYDLAAVVEQARAKFSVPIFTGLPFGHCRDKLTLPFGGQCALTVGNDGAAILEFSVYR